MTPLEFCTAKNPLPWMATSVGTPVALMLPWVNKEGIEPTWVPAPTWIGSPEPVVPRFW
jgi:hypothetical protein